VSLPRRFTGSLYLQKPYPEGFRKTTLYRSRARERGRERERETALKIDKFGKPIDVCGRIVLKCSTRVVLLEIS
jgi:hypothetical protein